MDNFILDLSVILVGASILSVLAIFIKQPIIIAYILCGVIIGPWGLGLIHQVDFLESISHLGITLLLFLAGLCLHPQKLIGLFRQTSLIALVNCFVSFVIAFVFAKIIHFNFEDSLCIGLSLMFSSTILVVKLLPTTRLHQERMGAVCISVLIFQDLLAVAVLVFIKASSSGAVLLDFGLIALKLVFLIAFLTVIEKYFLRRIILRIERIQEALFILGLAWCFGIASISHNMGLFYETGAFFAGVILARHKISFFISEKLKPLRDFFLVLFFFSLGADMNLFVMKDVLIPAIILGGVFVVVKPWVFTLMFSISGEKAPFAKETGARLGQLSEFSLLVAILAFQVGYITDRAVQLIQAVTILTFIVSGYYVVLKYPTPIGTEDRLIRD